MDRPHDRVRNLAQVDLPVRVLVNLVAIGKGIYQIARGSLGEEELSLPVLVLPRWR